MAIKLIGACITVLGVLGVIAAVVLSAGIVPLVVAGAAVPVGALTILGGRKLGLFRTIETERHPLKRYTETVTDELLKSIK